MALTFLGILTDQRIRLEFLAYRSSAGAYLFMPEGDPKWSFPKHERTPPLVRVVVGSVLTEVHVQRAGLRHVTRLCPTQVGR